VEVSVPQRAPSLLIAGLEDAAAVDFIYRDQVSGGGHSEKCKTFVSVKQNS